MGHDEASAILLEGDERSRPGHFEPAVLHAFERVQGRFEALFAEAEAPAAAVLEIAA